MARAVLTPLLPLVLLLAACADQRTESPATLVHWNQVAVNASGLDHTRPGPGQTHVFGEQLGPGRSSCAMAIVHIAMFDALNSIHHGYHGYTGIPNVGRDTSMSAAIAQAAHDTLVVLFPSQAATFDRELQATLDSLKADAARARGIETGARAAAAILARRANDGSHHPEPGMGTDYIPGNDPGTWRMDPVSQIPVALGWHWGEVQPFVLDSGSQFRVPPPPDLRSAEYAQAYNEVKALGGDGIRTATSRTPEQTEIGIFWAYDGTPSLCAPPRLYNQIAVQIARERGSDIIETARLLALLNVAMADAGIAIWESKYTYAFWRPVTGIREADAGTGPTRRGDGNPQTEGDAGFSPLGAPRSNAQGPNFTPPFPAYPSGHAGFGGAIFQVMRAFYGTDDIAFTFESDELNGHTLDNQGNVRPSRPRSFSNLSQAEEENGQSRIYLGIHWSFDKEKGIALGRQVGQWTFDHAFTPIP